MFKQILVAMAGAVAAQLTAATLSFTPNVADERQAYQPQQAVVRLAIVPGTTGDIFAAPVVAAKMAPFLGAPQMMHRE